MNDFGKDLEFSHKCEDDPCWGIIYKKAFPTMQAYINHRKDGEHQRNGIDRTVVLENGKTIWIDEKARRIKDTNDIMLEYVSNDNTKTLGWAEKPLLADYIVYAFIPSGIAYLLPVVQMQSAWKENKTEWLKKYGTKSAQNSNYNTLNCPVPTRELFTKILNMLIINFSTKAI